MPKKISQTLNDWRGDRFRLAGAALVVGAFLIVGASAACKKLSVAREAHARETELAEGPRVRVAAAAMSSPERNVNLISELKPYETVTLYAKVSGYLDQVSADKGDRVVKDQVLAVIQSPETDREYDGALADAVNKKRIAERYKPLLEKKLVSQQEADQAFSDADQAQARLDVASTMRGYEEIRAPFDGVVTARYADPRALVQNATNAQTGALPVFTVSKTDRLRVTFYIDQKDAPYVRAGTPVTVSLQERPDVSVKAKVTRVAGQLDSATRTMLAEVELEDRDGRFVPGGFAQVALQVKASPQLEIPVEALVTRKDKTVVPVVKEGHVTYREISVGDNDGRNVRVVSGLSSGELVALNLGNSVNDGDPIRIAEDAPAAHP
jgi:RND family efflux transporter MFP subunit